MHIATRQHIGTATTLASIGLIAGAMLWTQALVADANAQRKQSTEITQGISELRLVTFDYLLNRHERARLQWQMASDRINRLIAESQFLEAEPREILDDLRARWVVVARMFGELAAANETSAVDQAGAQAKRLFEAQLVGQILIGQQNNQADALRLTDISARRIAAAQQQAVQAVLAGLVLIALITAGASWRMHRDVVTPIIRLQRAALKVAGGGKDISFDLTRRDEIGELSRYLADMTASLRSLIERAELSNRELAALNLELEAFSYSVSHDLRAPLRSMDGFSQVLLEDYGDKLDAEGQDALQRIRAASQRMGLLIDDLLRLSQVTRGELHCKPVDLSLLARRIVDGLEQEQPGRGVQWDIEQGMTLTADPALMAIVMQDLLQNAWKFTGKTAGALIRVGSVEREGLRTFFVADNGAGFDMGHAQKLFSAFQRLHHAGDFPGTGIGLTIVQRILRRHDGRIWAEASEGAGATFFFNLRETDHEAERKDHPAG